MAAAPSSIVPKNTDWIALFEKVQLGAWLGVNADEAMNLSPEDLLLARVCRIVGNVLGANDGQDLKLAEKFLKAKKFNHIDSITPFITKAVEVLGDFIPYFQMFPLAKFLSVVKEADKQDRLIEYKALLIHFHTVVHNGLISPGFRDFWNSNMAAIEDQENMDKVLTCLEDICVPRFQFPPHLLPPPTCAPSPDALCAAAEYKADGRRLLTQIMQNPEIIQYIEDLKKAIDNGAAIYFTSADKWIRPALQITSDLQRLSTNLNRVRLLSRGEITGTLCAATISRIQQSFAEVPPPVIPMFVDKIKGSNPELANALDQALLSVAVPVAPSRGGVPKPESPAIGAVAVVNSKEKNEEKFLEKIAFITRCFLSLYGDDIFAQIPINTAEQIQRHQDARGDGLRKFGDDSYKMIEEKFWLIPGLRHMVYFAFTLPSHGCANLIYGRRNAAPDQPTLQQPQPQPQPLAALTDGTEQPETLALTDGTEQREDALPDQAAAPTPASDSVAAALAAAPSTNAGPAPIDPADTLAAEMTDEEKEAANRTKYGSLC